MEFRWRGHDALFNKEATRKIEVFTRIVCVNAKFIQ